MFFPSSSVWWLLAFLVTAFLPSLPLSSHYLLLCVSQISLYLFLIRIIVIGFQAHPHNIDDGLVSRFLV